MHQEEWQSPRADWSTWGRVRYARLWHAIALSLDVEPNALAIDWKQGDPFETCPEEFRARLEAANRRLGDMHTGHTPDLVVLPKFAALAVSMNWELPDEFQRMADEPAAELQAG